MKNQTYNTDDIFVGDIIRADNALKQNDYYFVQGPLQSKGRNNLFIKEGRLYKSITSGKVYKKLKYPCKAGEIGLNEFSVKPLSQKLMLGMKVHNLKNMQLSFEQVSALESMLGAVNSENDMDYAYIFGKFYEYVAGGIERGE